MNALIIISNRHVSKASGVRSKRVGVVPPGWSPMFEPLHSRHSSRWMCRCGSSGGYRAAGSAVDGVDRVTPPAPTQRPEPTLGFAAGSQVAHQRFERVVVEDGWLAPDSRLDRPRQ